MMEWLVFKKNNLELGVIERFEKKIGYSYPDIFKTIAKQFDGGTPKLTEFDTKETEGCVFNNLLSFDINKKTSVWTLVKDCSSDGCCWNIEGFDWRFVPFARDPFGNFICFDRTNDHIVFWDHETGEVEEVADSFGEFIDSLYESDD